MTLKLIEQTQPAAIASYGHLYVDAATGLLRFRESTGFGSDDFQVSPSEGTWTPSWSGTGTAGTFTYTASTGQTGHYQRIGNLVHVRARLSITAISVSPTGNMQINGLPFTVEDDVTVTNAVSFGFISQMDFSANIVQLTGFFVGNTTRIDIYEVFDNAASTQYPAANFTNAACNIILSGTYRVKT